MRKKFKAALCISVCAVLFMLCSCQEKVAGRRTFALGTVCEQSIYSTADMDIPSLLKSGEDIMNRMDSLISTSRDASEINKISQNSGESVECDAQTADLISRAKQLAEQTGGAFDPTLGALTAAWDFNGEPRVPSDEEIAELLKTVDYTKIEVENTEQSHSASVGQGQRLDLGGIAKGYITDLLTELYIQHGVTRALINLGGNIRTIGEFELGIRDPQGEASDSFCTITLKDKSIVTSGGYIRNFEQDGVTYHHILDPKTGKPAESDILSVSIISESSTLADAYSTAVFVLGSESGLKLVENTDDAECIIVTSDDKIIMSSGFEELCSPVFETDKYQK